MAPSSSTRLYDAFARDYDAAFEVASHRRAYDLLAWEFVCPLLPETPGIVVDAGCGTGRWAQRLLCLGHRVIGIEPAPEMVKAIKSKALGAGFTLREAEMETAEIAPGSVDVVLAMGSLQYARDPAQVLARFANWIKPGGVVCVHVDSLVALVLELLRQSKSAEALDRLANGRGVFTFAGERAGVRLYDRASLERDLAGAGLIDISARGLLVTAAAWGSQGCTQAVTQEEDAFLDLERRLRAAPLLADVGKHIIASGRRPSAPMT